LLDQFCGATYKTTYVKHALIKTDRWKAQQYSDIRSKPFDPTLENKLINMFDFDPATIQSSEAFEFKPLSQTTLLHPCVTYPELMDGHQY